MDDRKNPVSRDEIIGELAKIAFASLEDVKAGEKLKALEFLAKASGAFGDSAVERGVSVEEYLRSLEDGD